MAAGASSYRNKKAIGHPGGKQEQRRERHAREWHSRYRAEQKRHSAPRPQGRARERRLDLASRPQRYRECSLDTLGPRDRRHRVPFHSSRGLLCCRTGSTNFPSTGRAPDARLRSAGERCRRRARFEGYRAKLKALRSRRRSPRRDTHRSYIPTRSPPARRDTTRCGLSRTSRRPPKGLPRRCGRR